MRGVFEVWQRQTHQAEEIIKSERSIHPVEVFFNNGHAVHQHLNDVLRGVVGNFQADNFSTHPSLSQALFDRDHQIVGFQVAELQVCIPGHSEKVMAFDAHSWKKQAEIEGNHLLKRHCRVQRL